MVDFFPYFHYPRINSWAILTPDAIIQENSVWLQISPFSPDIGSRIRAVAWVVLSAFNFIVLPFRQMLDGVFFVRRSLTLRLWKVCLSGKTEMTGSTEIQSTFRKFDDLSNFMNFQLSNCFRLEKPNFHHRRIYSAEKRLPHHLLPERQNK